MTQAEKETMEAELAEAKENIEKVLEERNEFQTNFDEMKMETSELNDEFSKFKEAFLKRNKDFCLIFEVMVDDLNELKQKLPKSRFFRKRKNAALKEIVNRLQSKLKADISIYKDV